MIKLRVLLLLSLMSIALSTFSQAGLDSVYTFQIVRSSGMYCMDGNNINRMASMKLHLLRLDKQVTSLESIVAGQDNVQDLLTSELNATKTEVQGLKASIDADRVKRPYIIGGSALGGLILGLLLK